MKINEEYVLQNIADEWVVVNTNSKSINFNKIISLNGTARFLWEKLVTGSDEAGLADALVEEYGIDRELADSDVKTYIEKLIELGCIER